MLFSNLQRMLQQALVTACDCSVAVCLGWCTLTASAWQFNHNVSTGPDDNSQL